MQRACGSNAGRAAQDRSDLHVYEVPHVHDASRGQKAPVPGHDADSASDPLP